MFNTFLGVFPEMFSLDLSTLNTNGSLLDAFAQLAFSFNEGSIWESVL